MTQDNPSSQYKTWLKALTGAIALGFVLGHIVGWELHSPTLGLKFGAFVALVFLLVRLTKPRWTIQSIVVLTLGTITFVSLYPVSQPPMLVGSGRQLPPEVLRRLETWEFM